MSKTLCVVDKVDFKIADAFIKGCLGTSGRAIFAKNTNIEVIDNALSGRYYYCMTHESLLDYVRVAKEMLCDSDYALLKRDYQYDIERLFNEGEE